MSERSTRYKVVFVAAAFVLAFGIRYGLNDHLPNGFPYLTFFPAVIVTAVFAGVRAGMVLGGLGGLAAWYFFIAPFNSFALTGNTLLALAFYVFIVATDVGLIYMMNGAMLNLSSEQRKSLALARSRELMFQELQHRVSNNLQVVASLLKLQQRKIEDPEARSALDAASARLGVVSRIQRSLHDPDRQQVDFARFLREIVSDIIEASGATARVISSVDADRIKVTSDQSIPLALICTEFLSNAVEHGLGASGTVTIRVSLKQIAPDRAAVEVSDNGAGLPTDFDLSQTRSLGLQIARQFTEQLNGTLSMATNGGTVARVEFPILPEEDSDFLLTGDAPALSAAT